MKDNKIGINQCMLNDNYRNDKRKALKTEKEQIAIKECTFHPTTIKELPNYVQVSSFGFDERIFKWNKICKETIEKQKVTFPIN